MARLMYNVKDVQEILGVGESKAYQFIRILNEELRGKSYMALGLCVAICQGAKFLGFDCTKHDCLYFDLESTKRRPKNRLDQIVGTGTKKPDNLHIITGDQSPGRIGEGFEEQVEYQLQKYPNIKLIVIDVFQLIRQPAKRNQTGYDRDYEDFRALKQIVDKHDIGVYLSPCTICGCNDNNI